MPPTYTPDPALRDYFVRYMAIESTPERAAIVEEIRQQAPESLAEFVLLVSKPRDNQFLDPPNVTIRPPGNDTPLVEDATSPVAVSPAPISMPPSATGFQTGEQIGPYKLLQKIGEGGFGVVYMAQQSAPVLRKVALKVIKPGMDSKEVIVRFEAERQALAMMDHPNVAKVLDGGTTDTGQPFFVMELVHGTPITKFCDANQLTNRQRLELFVDVCRAVQHAHLKGIIHRDLKPSNVLVTINDDRPMPKVIDFGISKALSQPLTEKTMFTAFGQMVGTPMYMSPEQAQLNANDVDVRSDVYSLGVLLYELLTGNTPYDRTILKQSGFDELRRIIREVEPPRPSACVSTLEAQARTTISEHRSVNDQELRRSLNGELDWIVMKALEKDRTRRYESASAFKDDIVRHLNGDQVQACPPSLSYRTRKLLARHRATVASLSIIFLILAVTSAVSLWKSIDAAEARDQADAARKVAENRGNQAEANYQKAVAAIDLMMEHVASDEFDRVPGIADVREDLFQSALEFYDQITAETPTNQLAQLRKAEALRKLQFVYEFLGQSQQATAAGQEALQTITQLSRTYPEDPEIQLKLGEIYMARFAQKFALTRNRDLTYIEQAIEIFESLIQCGDPNVARPAKLSLGAAYSLKADHLPPHESAQRYPLYEQAVAISQGGQMNHILALLRKGRFELQTDRHPQAVNTAASAVETAREWVTTVRENSRATHHGRYSRQLLYETLMLQAFVYDAQHNPAAAAAARAEALEVAQELNREYPDSPLFERWVLGQQSANAPEFRAYVDAKLHASRLKTVQQLVESGQSRKVLELLIGLQAEGQPQQSQAFLDALIQATSSSPSNELEVDEIHERYASSVYGTDESLAWLSTAIAQYPDVGVYRRYRAILYLQRGEAEAAIEDVNQALELGEFSRGYYPAYQLTLLSLSLNRVSQYQALCWKLLETYPGPEPPLESYFIAWTCSLAPHAVDDYDTVLMLARQAADQEPDSAQFLGGWGAALLRAGKVQEAQTQLSKALAAVESERTSRAYLHYFLAMAEFELGNMEVAKTQLQTANELAEAEQSDSLPWNRKVTLELLRKEAETRIGSSASESTTNQ